MIVKHLRAGPAAPRDYAANPDLSWFGPSTLDWCEENYAVTPFIAEFWNTLSNSVMVLTAIYGLRWCVRLRAAPRFVAAFIGLLVIGVGSFAFHGTLTYGAQLLDELPMIWATCVFVYCALPLGPGSKHATNAQVLLSLYSAVVTLLYTTVLKHQPVFHEVSYGLLVFSLVVLCIRGISVAPAKYRSSLAQLFARSVLSYGAGFLLWNLENFFCGRVRSLRQVMTDAGAGLLTPMVQLHAWWHLAQVGTYSTITLLYMLHRTSPSCCPEEDTDAVRIKYVLGGIVPLPYRVAAAKRNT